MYCAGLSNPCFGGTRPCDRLQLERPLVADADVSAEAVLLARPMADARRIRDDLLLPDLYPDRGFRGAKQNAGLCDVVDGLYGDFVWVGDDCALDADDSPLRLRRRSGECAGFANLRSDAAETSKAEHSGSQG